MHHENDTTTLAPRHVAASLAGMRAHHAPSPRRRAESGAGPSRRRSTPSSRRWRPTTAASPPTRSGSCATTSTPARTMPRAARECETKLLPFLKGAATPSAQGGRRQAAAGDRRRHGHAGAAGDGRRPESADYAIYVLQPMPGAAAETALVQSLKTARGAQKTAVVAALGQRRAAAALPLLEPMLREPALADGRRDAIGRIGGPAAAAALRRPTPPRRANRSGCWPRRCSRPPTACSRRRSPRPRAAVTARSRPTARCRPRCGGPRSSGNISAAGPRARRPPRRDAGRRRCGRARGGHRADRADVIPPDGIGPVCDLLPRLPELAQVQVLAALSGYPAARVRPAGPPGGAKASRQTRCAWLPSGARAVGRRVCGAVPRGDRGHRAERARAGRGAPRARQPRAAARSTRPSSARWGGRRRTASRPNC